MRQDVDQRSLEWRPARLAFVMAFLSLARRNGKVGVRAFTEAFQQLRCSMQVNFGTRDSGMSEISRQQWQLSEKVRPFAMPRQQTIYGKCVTKVVNTRSALALRTTDAKFPNDFEKDSGNR